MSIFKLISGTKKKVWNVLGSEKTVSALKLAAAMVATIHAIEEFRDASKAAKKKIGFSSNDE